MPELPASDAGITIYELLDHTGGLIDYEDLIPSSTTRRVDDDDVLRMIASQHRLYFTPGSAHRYSNATSIDDLTRWDAALYDNRLLNAASRKMAFTAHEPLDDPDAGYGFGWRVSGDSVWHSGETEGFRNVIIRWTDDGRQVIGAHARGGRSGCRHCCRQQEDRRCDTQTRYSPCSRHEADLNLVHRHALPAGCLDPWSVTRIAAHINDPIYRPIDPS